MAFENLKFPLDLMSDELRASDNEFTEVFSDMSRQAVIKASQIAINKTDFLTKIFHILKSKRSEQKWVLTFSPMNGCIGSVGGIAG